MASEPQSESMAESNNPPRRSETDSEHSHDNALLDDKQMISPYNLSPPESLPPSDSPRYGDDGISGLPPKKRVGRAAPPGRCHSCNRAETPEWRRGPDGARTLCNACGLHYAKLTRKNRLKNSGGDGISPGTASEPLRSDDKVYKCAECDFESTSQKQQVNHLLTHARGFVTICRICESQFESYDQYEPHFRQHAQEMHRLCSETSGSKKLEVLPLQKRTNLKNRIKRAIEGFTGASWDWWPLEQYQPEPTARIDRLHWQCSCGDDRFEDVPRLFAETLLDDARSQRVNLPVTDQEPQTTSSNTEFPAPDQGDSNQGGEESLSAPSNIPVRLSPYSGSSLTSIGGITQTATESYNPIQLHVLLSVPIGSEIFLKHINITDFNDEKFFRSLRLAYLDAKGLIRRILGVWQYSHCNFFKFEKFDEGEIAPRGPGIPAPDNNEYQYNPKPVKDMPPITEHEFRNRFYACYGRCLPALFGLRNPFHRCRKPCRYSPEAVNRVPKRLWPLEMGGDARETFWGLYVVENISFLRVAIFHAIVIVPALVFWFLWLFYWDHSGDLQNASVPFLCALGVISLFWYPLYGGKAGVGVQ